MRKAFVALCLAAGILIAPGAVAQTVTSQPWFGNGRIHFAPNPSRPAVLLVHGLGATGTSTWIKPSLFGVNWNYMTDPAPRNLGGGHGKPGVGTYEFGLSDMLDVDPMNFFDELANAGFTVAEFDQQPRSFANALSTTLTAFDTFVEDTRAMSPTAPPPIALLGHSRGGLVIRAVLNQKGTVGRVRWVITLHSPHTGSDMARFASACGTWPGMTNFGPFNAQRDAITAVVSTALAPFNSLVNNPAQAELAPGGSVVTSVSTGEVKLPFVRYVTFGGTSPRYVRTYAWNFTPQSALPVGGSLVPPVPPTYSWGVVPLELAPFASPLTDVLPHCTAELTPGAGDFLVADSRSHLSFEDRHVTSALNHAEVLWNRDVQKTIEGELNAQLTPIPIALVPQTADVGYGTTRQFTVTPPNIVAVQFSVESGPGSVASDGTYRAPQPQVCHSWCSWRWCRPCPRTPPQAVVAARALDGSGRVARATVTIR